VRKNCALSSCRGAASSSSCSSSSSSSRLVLAADSGHRLRRLPVVSAHLRPLVDLVSHPWVEALEAPPNPLASVRLLYPHREGSVSLPWEVVSGAAPLRLASVHLQHPAVADSGAADSAPQLPQLASEVSPPLLAVSGLLPYPHLVVASAPQPRLRQEASAHQPSPRLSVPRLQRVVSALLPPAALAHQQRLRRVALEARLRLVGSAHQVPRQLSAVHPSPAASVALLRLQGALASPQHLLLADSARRRRLVADSAHRRRLVADSAHRRRLVADSARSLRLHQHSVQLLRVLLVPLGLAALVLLSRPRLRLLLPPR